MAKSTQIIGSVVKRAQQVLAIDMSVDIDQFIDTLSIYLDEFNEWAALAVEENPLGEDSTLVEAEKDSFRESAIFLNDLHRRITLQSEVCKSLIGEKIVDSNRRSAGLKKYIDRFPKRISITGKRKG